jgi:hypothetical protein
LDGDDPGFFRLQLAYWKGVGKGAVNTVAGTPGFVYRALRHPIDTIESVYDDVSGRIKTLYEIVRHPGEGLDAIRDAIAELGPEKSMEIIGDSGGQVVGFRFLGNLQQWIKEATEAWITKYCKVAKATEIVDLTDSRARTHILDGDATGGGHRYGTGISGKSEFPASWSDGDILHHISDVASDPASIRTPSWGGRTVVQGTRMGVDIKVILDNPANNGRIVTGFPTNMPRNP